MGPVNDYVSSIVVAQLLFLQSESAKKPIHLYIISPGGSVTAGLAIYDTMQYVLPPICKFFFQILWKSKCDILVTFPSHLKKLRSILRY